MGCPFSGPVRSASRYDLCPTHRQPYLQIGADGSLSLLTEAEAAALGGNHQRPELVSSVKPAVAKEIGWLLRTIRRRLSAST